MDAMTADEISNGVSPGAFLSPVFDTSSPVDTVTAANNPSNGISTNDLFSQLLGSAGNAFQVAQNSQVAQSIAQAQIAASQGSPGNPLAVFSTANGKTWLLIGAGILALALILRK